MDIGIIGSGHVGGRLGVLWAQSGHRICFSFSREPHKLTALASVAGANAHSASPSEAARFGEVALLAVPWPRHVDLLNETGSLLAGKVLLSCVIPWRPDRSGLEIGTTTSAAEEIANLAPTAHVVEALPFLVDNLPVDNPGRQPGERGAEPASIFYCGDHWGSKEIAAELLEELGLEAVNAGALSSARYLEPMAALLWSMAVSFGEGTDIALNLLRRSSPI